MITFTCDVCGDSVTTAEFYSGDDKRRIRVPKDWIVRMDEHFTRVLLCSQPCEHKYLMHAAWQPPTKAGVNNPAKLSRQTIPSNLREAVSR